MSPPAWNTFGARVQSELADDDFVAAILAVEGEDSDEDNVSNAAEIMAGTSPGDGDQRWCAAAEHVDVAATRRDHVLAYRRVSALFCGAAPTYEESAGFARLADEEAAQAAVHDKLSECLAGAFWRDVALPRLGDVYITPILVYGRDSPASVTLGDYEWDYRLWTYIMSGDRDVRDLLLADYHVRQAADGTFERVEGVIPGDIDPPPQIGFPGGQPLVPERRAGLLTTQWYLAHNTFLSGMPRTSAAQAYRAFLGHDIARLEGIRPVEHEPFDYDSRGVGAPECAMCHSTLDPLAYAFVQYNGIPTVPGSPAGSYDPRRPLRTFPAWDRPSPWLLDEPVADLRAWALRASESEDFRHALGNTLFSYAFDREATPEEFHGFDACWRGLPEQGWTANALIHCLIDLPNFAAGGLS